MNPIGILLQDKNIFGFQFIDLNVLPKTIFYINPDEFPDGFSFNDFEKIWNIKFINIDPSLKSIKSSLIYYTKGILNNPFIVLS